MRTCSIASLTVAYNSVEALGKQMNALLGQSRRLDEIIVIDNGSQDTTIQMLRSEYPQVTVIENNENLGIGAGLAAGLSYSALRKKYDFTWLLDQDSLPETNALEELIRGYEVCEQQGKTIGVVACIAAHVDSGLSYPGLLWRDRLVEPPAESLAQSIWFVDATISSGSLVNRKVVESVGLPRADFFMDIVDIEYCLRIRRHGFQIAIVRDSILHHTLGSPRVFQFLGYKKAWSDHAPWRQYYIVRNHTYLVWRFYPGTASKFFMLARVASHSFAGLLFSTHRFESLRMMLLGFVDGMAGKLGIRFRDDSSNNIEPNPKISYHDTNFTGV
jgi:GT2 family glycosyltransferase